MQSVGAACRDIRPVRLAVSVLLGAAAVLLDTTGAYARSDFATAATVSTGDEGPNLLVNAVAAGVVALLLIGGFLVVRHAWTTYRSKP